MKTNFLSLLEGLHFLLLLFFFLLIAVFNFFPLQSFYAYYAQFWFIFSQNLTFFVRLTEVIAVSSRLFFDLGNMTETKKKGQ